MHTCPSEVRMTCHLYSVNFLKSESACLLHAFPSLVCLGACARPDRGIFRVCKWLVSPSLVLTRPPLYPKSVRITQSERACAKAYTSVQPLAYTSAPATACISLGLDKCVYTQPPVDLDKGPLLARPLVCLEYNNEGLLVVPWHPCNITKTQTPGHWSLRCKASVEGPRVPPRTLPGSHAGSPLQPAGMPVQTFLPACFCTLSNTS